VEDRRTIAGRHELIELLGSGMGEVDRARDRELEACRAQGHPHRSRERAWSRREVSPRGQAGERADRGRRPGRARRLREGCSTCTGSTAVQCSRACAARPRLQTCESWSRRARARSTTPGDRARDQL